jgi:hypothetical protein
MTLPNFVIAGTARSGTTSLYYYLKQHPDITFPKIKEPKYFSSLGQKFPHNGPGDNTVDKAVVYEFMTYQSLFQGLDKTIRIGDASSDYLYHHHHSAQNIYSVLGDVPIIICLRNPVDRAYSSYNNLLRDQREKLTFQDALNSEEQRIRDNWDWMWAYKAGGLYADQVETFLNIFSRVKVVLFDDLTLNTDAVVRALFEFLDVDPSVIVDTSTRYSHSGKAKNIVYAFLSNRENSLSFMLRTLAMKFIPRSVLERIAHESLIQEPLDSDIRKQLNSYFLSDIEKLEKILRINLDAWK